MPTKMKKKESGKMVLSHMRCVTAETPATTHTSSRREPAALPMYMPRRRMAKTARRIPRKAMRRQKLRRMRRRRGSRR